MHGGNRFVYTLISVSHLPKDYVRESGKDLKHAFILCLHLPRTYAHAHTHTCVCVCMCVRERKRESSPSTLFEAENILSFPAVHTGIAGLGASGVSHLASGCWCYRSARPCPAFTWVLGLQIQVVKPLGKALYPLIHCSSPRMFVFN